jgi:catechol 2,3-dioxygenase-like lactoylglutathione lyase family enzyme
MDYKLELVIMPVTDIDRAKDFYENRAGFHVDVDHSAGEDFRIVQLTPPGSACSITLMRNPEAAGSLHGLHLVVSDIDQARAELTGRGVEASELFHYGESGQTPGPHPARAKYGTFMSFSDPDGNSFLVQEAKRDEQVG